MDDPQERQRRRRAMMQVIMVVLLGATVGLALLVNQTVSRPQHVSGGGVTIQLPHTWQVIQTTDPRVVIAAFDPRGGREILVTRQRVGPGTGAAEYLRQSGHLHPDYQRTANARIVDQGPIQMAGQNGLIVIGVRIQPPADIPRMELIATAILPRREAVTVLLLGEGVPTTADVALLQQIARTMQVQN